MTCALIKAHAIAPSKIASPLSCLPLAAWPYVNLVTDILQPGNKPCPRIAPTDRERHATVWPPFTFFEARISILQLWCTLCSCMSGSTCIERNLGIAEGNMAKKAKKAKKTTGKKKKK